MLEVVAAAACVTVLFYKRHSKTLSLICFCVSLSVSHAAKHHRLPQPGRPERLPLPAGRHGGPPVYAAAGEGRTDGWNGGSQRPARGTAGRGPCSSSWRLLPSLPTAVCFFFFWFLPFSLHFQFPSSARLQFYRLCGSLVPRMELIDRSALVETRRTPISSSFFVAVWQEFLPYPFEVDLNDVDAALKAKSRVKASRLLAAETFLWSHAEGFFFREVESFQGWVLLQFKNNSAEWNCRATHACPT